MPDMPDPPDTPDTSNVTELAFLTATEAAARIGRGDLSPVELVRARLGQVERHEGRLNCFITLRAQAALAEAAAAAARVAQEVALPGIPMAIKDNIETAGVRSTGGSKILGDHVPAADAPAWGRLLSAQFMLAGDYATAMRARRLLRQRYDAALAQVDLIAAPTVPVAAPTIAEAEADVFPVGGKPGDAGALSRNTRPANLTGLPAISVLGGFDRGLPVGLMRMGRAFDEESVLWAAAAYEATTEWRRARPPGA